MYNNPYMYQQPYTGVQTNSQFNNTGVQMPQQVAQPTFQRPVGLMGKTVDSIEVVKAMDIPLDGSVNYYPLVDNSAIVTKQLQTDGTSKITIYKPIKEEKEETTKYATIEDINNAIQQIDLSELEDLMDLKEDIKDIKKQLKELKLKKEKSE